MSQDCENLPFTVDTTSITQLSSRGPCCKDLLKIVVYTQTQDGLQIKNQIKV